jgi:glycine/D-amino acid oxidase-like deaminating enzyme
MSHLPDVVIAGAGIVGAACALDLVREGARVEVWDPAIPGGGATAAGMGHLVVLDGCEAELALSRLSVELWHEMAADLPAPAEFWNCGTLWVAADEVEMDAARTKYEVYTRCGLAAELLDEQQLYEAEPHLRPGLAGGLLARRDAVVYAPAATRWLLTRAGVAVKRQGVERFDDIAAGAVVCATGAFTPRLLPALPVRPRKGHLAITDRYPELVRHQLVELGYLQSAHGDSDESVAFNVQPRPTGQLLIGSSRQYGVEHPEIDPPILARMLERAFAYLPALRECAVVRTWTGFRASTPDKLPLIGPLRGNLFLAAGHEGLGVTTALGTAKLLTAHILQRTPPIPAAPYLPGRFHA